MSASVGDRHRRWSRGRRRRIRGRRMALYAFLLFMSALWLFPLFWAIYTALRPYADTQQHGYISMPTNLNFDNFVNAWNQGNFPQFYLNTLDRHGPGRDRHPASARRWWPSPSRVSAGASTCSS